ncbi:MAG: hypothetical protein C0404_00650 [Verrucomicrobia bacterium]|nr:hypothetical protein [Verrucomicrobiota bacterium]
MIENTTMKTNNMNSAPSNRRSGRMLAVVLSACVVVGGATGAGCASSRVAATTEPSPAAMLKETWGVEVTSLRMSGNGHLVDFRYKVLDADKAAMLGDRRYAPCLIDQATGTQLKVPNTPKLGPLRQSATRLEAGKIYFMLFANAGLLVKSGSKVTIVIGDFRLENQVVE